MGFESNGRIDWDKIANQPNVFEGDNFFNDEFDRNFFDLDHGGEGNENNDDGGFDADWEDDEEGDDGEYNNDAPGDDDGNENEDDFEGDIEGDFDPATEKCDRKFLRNNR